MVFHALKLGFHPQPLAVFALSGLITFGFAFVSWHSIEKPALSLKRRFKSEKPIPASVATSQ